MPNTLIFFDIPSDDPAAAGIFYSEVFGWQNDLKPEGTYHRMVPGGQFPNPDGSDSEIGNLHMGIFNAANARPHPDADGAEPRTIATDGRRPRIWILIGDEDSPEAILGRAVERGATVLWTKHYWSTFNGLNHAFRDPWGNDIVLWEKGGESPEIPADYTRE
ncbi:VOC family protein [Novosphingobium aquimarinum]|uniref:VOC family protein n=1 Tax=Novosphingobium aquimarinum TaxID=2682494 RepID=UPI0012EBEFE0|nr:VOC family protein [Novosphingobium aquimarinum]